MALTDIEIRKAKAPDALTKLSDGAGLQLWLTPDGAKRWRLAYRFGGKQKVLALGVYPAVGLAEARTEAASARARIKGGEDPAQARRIAKATEAASREATFGVIAARLMGRKRAEAKAGATLDKTEWLLSLALPEFGERPIAKITAAEVLVVLRSVESRGRLETAKRLRATIGQVFRLAIAEGLADNDPTFALRGAIASPKVEHRAAITEPKAFGGLLRAIADYQGAPETRAAMQLLALTFARPGEIRAAEWSEIDLDAALWEIPAERMKMRRPHRVPLAPQAAAILTELRGITGQGRFLFPSVRSSARVMSENTLNAALRRMGFAQGEMTSHGFRAAASSMLNESGLWNADAIEAQLAHVEANAVRRAYARAEYWDERVKMMAWWADRCDDMRRGGEVVRFRESGGSAA